MQCARILLVTSAPGVDTSMLVRLVEERGVAGASFHPVDTTSSLSSDVAARDYECTAAAYATMAERWIERLARREGLCVLEGHVWPSIARDAFARHHVDGHIVVIDGAPTGDDGFRASSQWPSLPVADQMRWVTELRRQVRALDVPVLDLSTLDHGAAADALHAHIAALAVA